ncbi:MAG: hypothetical protein AAB665_03590 [Patescibacteria group bacterium]
MKLRYKNAATVDLENFVNRYREAFCVLYSDTGLWNENLIIAGYERSATHLHDEIDGAIRSRLDERTVIGRKQITGDWSEVTVSVGTRQIFVLYSEDKKQNIRWVESISIDRKPIIF